MKGIMERSFVGPTRVGPKRRALYCTMVFLGGLSEGNANTSSGAFNGFYAGANLGYAHQNTHVDAKQNPGDVRADMHSSISGRVSPILEAFLGWGRVFGRHFYGGIEGKIDLVVQGSQKIAEDTNFVYHHSRKGVGFGALIRIGYLVNPSAMVYGGVGAKTVNFHQDLLERAHQISAPFSKRSLHLLTEVGFERVFDTLPHLVYRFSYSFMPKRIISRGNKTFPRNHIYSESGLFQTGTSEHIVKTGIAYRF